MEILDIEDEGNNNNISYWCQKELKDMPVSLDGAVIAMINMHSFVHSHIGDSTFTSAHNSLIHDKALLCGGANTGYNISNECFWYSLEAQTWKSGPKLSKSRYSASVVNTNKGIVWITGGRNGSAILQVN